MLPDSTLRLLGILFLLWKICNQAIGTFHREQDSRRTTDAGVAASDDRSFVLQLPSSPVSLVAAIFSRDVFGLRVGFLHFTLKTWMFLIVNGDFMA
jgi:hypothetical protein